MDVKKQKAFNEKMSLKKRFPYHQNMDKGGMVKRKKFAEGGTAYGGSYIPSNPAGAPVNNTPAGSFSNAVDSQSQGFLGSIGQTLGLNNSFQAGNANVQAGTNADQLNAAYGGANNSINSQIGLANTLNPQVGTAARNQNALAGQYLDMTQGRGPNPALAQLAQATGQNVANQSAMMAGQRGAASNVGLIARQAAQQGAETQQNAVGQAATLQAQQQIAAQQNLANLSNAQISQAGQANTGLSSAQQNEQALLQNANANYNNAAVGMQSNLNNVNSQVAAANQNQNTNILNAGLGIVGDIFGGGLFAEGGEVEPNLGTFDASQSSVASPSVPSTGSLPSNSTNLSSALKGGVDPSQLAQLAPMLAGMAQGGQIQANPLIAPQVQPMQASNWASNYMGAGSVASPNIPTTDALPKNPIDLSSAFKKDKKKKADDTTPDATLDKPTSGDAWASWAGAPGETTNGTVPTGDATFNMYQSLPQVAYAAGGNVHPGPHRSHVANYLMAEGGSVPALVSPKEVYLSPDKVQKVLHEGSDPMKIGHHFPGKDVVKKKNSTKNDRIPVTLQEGGCVVPISVTTHKDASHKSREFVLKHMKKPKGQ